MRRLLLRRAVAAVCIAAAALTCTAHAGAAAADTPALRVSVLGDSVLLGAHDALVSELAGWQLNVDTRQDLSLLGAISTLANLATTSDVVVLDLGYNDTSATGVFAARIDQAMAALAPVRRVMWVNQREFQPGRAEMNDALEAAAAKYRNLEVVDWNAVASAHPEYLAPDGIHLGPAGQQAMADLIVAHLQAFSSSLAPKSATTAAPPASTAPAATAAPRDDGRVAAAPDPSVPAGDSHVWWIVGGVAALVVLGGAAALVARRRSHLPRSRAT